MCRSLAHGGATCLLGARELDQLISSGNAHVIIRLWISLCVQVTGAGNLVKAAVWPEGSEDPGDIVFSETPFGPEIPFEGPCTRIQFLGRLHVLHTCLSLQRV
jgi:hypothetical protein